jgi:putative membrane protein
MVAFDFVWIIGFLFVAVVVIGVVLLLAAVFRSRPLSPATAPPMGETPLEILDRRFAAGEIGAEEYKRARDLLGGGGKT